MNQGSGGAFTLDPCLDLALTDFEDRGIVDGEVTASGVAGRRPGPAAKDPQPPRHRKPDFGSLLLLPPSDASREGSLLAVTDADDACQPAEFGTVRL